MIRYESLQVETDKERQKENDNEKDIEREKRKGTYPGPRGR